MNAENVTGITIEKNDRCKFIYMGFVGFLNSEVLGFLTVGIVECTGYDPIFGPVFVIN